MASKAKQILDQAVDAIEKCSSPASRAGNSVERIGKLDASGVPRKDIAALLNARTGAKWTTAEVGALSKAYSESRRRVLVTAAQATALRANAAHEKQGDSDDDAIANPA